MSRPSLEPKKVLILALSGIGNVLMQLPTIEAIKKARPQWHITVWVAPRGTRPLLEGNPAIDHIIEGKIKRSLLGHLHFAGRLRRLKPDIALMLSPGQLIKGAAYMLVSGADERVAHMYPHLGNPHGHLFLTKHIPEEEKIHDIEQNLRLLDLLNIPLPDQPTYHFNPQPTAQIRATEIIQHFKLPSHKKLVGLHPGSAPNFLWKRWPLTNFAHVGKALIANDNAHLLIFGGADEKKIKKELKKLINQPHVSLIQESLPVVAALMKHCQFTLANDSGLMHLSAAVGTPTFGIFGPTDEATTGPRGAHSHVIRAPHTTPVYHTEHNPDLGQEPHASLVALSPHEVVAALADYTKSASS